MCSNEPSLEQLQILLRPGMFFLAPRHENRREIEQALSETPDGITRTVFDLKKLEIVAMANPIAERTYVENGEVKAISSDDIMRQMTDESVNQRLAALAKIRKLKEGEELWFSITYEISPYGPVRADFVSHPLIGSAEQTILFVSDVTYTRLK